MQDMAEIRLNGMPVEACLLDYVEGRLSAEETRTVEAFLSEHADWAAQVALLREPMAVSADAASAVADGLAADGLATGFAAGLACPPELKARLWRPARRADGPAGGVRFGHFARSVRSAWDVLSVRAVRRRVYYAAAAVAVLLVASGIVWRTAGDRPEVGPVLSASVDVAPAAATVEAGAVLSAEAGLTGTVLPAEPSLETATEPAVAEARQVTAPVKSATVAAVEGAVPAASTVASATVAVEETADKPSRVFFDIQPLRAAHLPADRFETGGQVQTLLARESVGTAAGSSGEVEARRFRFEPDALIAQAYVALARRIERQRIRKEIQREVTASLQADAETRPAFWNIYN